MVFNESIQECEVLHYEIQLKAPGISTIAEILIDIEMQVLLVHPTELDRRKTLK